MACEKCRKIRQQNRQIQELTESLAAANKRADKARDYGAKMEAKYLEAKAKLKQTEEQQ